ncbi:hypothetical protein BK771_11600 [Bacillus thuringiensis serovar ostriniae]|uniref:BppU family phage baseplate upper protein n=1 Tax=Bacillus thuringiensis TaxID=1428 RepID=UPI000A37347A|nr:BppU family phage baseplate upper protein [Bacillus thuringiensis]OTZ87318.1 hypothetical protein BK771_11600 [Bacillus thuringiensis serovar ostriniae]
MKTKLILDINKKQHAQLNSIVTGRVGDKWSNTVDVYVIDGFVPYNLTGSDIYFECAKPDNTSVRDKNGITMIDAAKGHFEYTFPTQTFASVGKSKQAYFTVEKNSTVKATTQDFIIVSIPDALTNRIPSKTYISQLDELIKELEEMQLDVLNSKAYKEAHDAKEFAEQANELSINIQKQLNEIVIHGDSSVEAAQARVEKNGTVHETLKAHTDAIHGEIDIIQNKVNDNAISPDDFKGTDYEKVQKAITYSIANKKSIRLSRMFDVTNTIPLYIDKDDNRWSLHFYGVGGGLKKTNSGYMFSTNRAYVGDINFNAVKFESTPGAGTTIFDSGNGKIIRVFSIGSIYRGVDCIAYSLNGYLQSYRFIGDSIVGGTGNVIETPGGFDMVFSNVLVEHRQNFFKQTSGTTSSYPSLYNVTFRDVCVEGLTGTAYQITSTSMLMIDGGYLEANSGGDIIFDPNGAYTGISISNLRAQITTNIDSRGVIKWGGTVQSAKVFNVVAVGLPVNDTSLIKVGYVSTENVRYQGTGGNTNIDPDKRIINLSMTGGNTNVNGITKTPLGGLTRIKKDSTVTVASNYYGKYTVTFDEPIRTDDSITIQMLKPDAQEIILCSYYKNGNNVDVWIKNNSNSSASVTLQITILKPYISVTG